MLPKDITLPEVRISAAASADIDSNKQFRGDLKFGVEDFKEFLGNLGVNFEAEGASHIICNFSDVEIVSIDELALENIIRETIPLPVAQERLRSNVEHFVITSSLRSGSMSFEAKNNKGATVAAKAELKVKPGITSSLNITPYDRKNTFKMNGPQNTKLVFGISYKQLLLSGDGKGLILRDIKDSEKSDGKPDPSQLPIYTKSISVAILDTGDMFFAQRIREGFTDVIRKQLPHANVDYFSSSAGTGGDPKSSPEWRNRANSIIERGKNQPYDYYVSIGTHATIALKNALGSEFGKVPFIFLGVSDPIEVGVVTRLQRRNDEREVAGVSYGQGIEEVVSIIRDLFPNQKLQYIYQHDVPQDIAMAKHLEISPCVTEGVVTIKETTQPPTLADMPDSNIVYFGWYTLDLLFEKGDGIELLKQRTVVASTEDNVKPRGLAIAAVAPEDRKIGELGADILIKHLTKHEKLGGMDIVIPEYNYFINVDTAKDKRIEFSPAAIKGATTIYK
jgi:ABC-type uncharacterized transport system substrate-binding protein